VLTPSRGFSRAQALADDEPAERFIPGDPLQAGTALVADKEKDQKERDWEKEMAEVDRLLKKVPYADPVPSRSSAPTVNRPSLGTSPLAEPAGPRTGGEWLGTWARVVLGLLVGIGITPGVWPYSHGCGLRLIFYLVGVAAVIAAGVSASVASWRRRQGFAHVVSQVLIVWGVLLMTREVVPRLGTNAEAPWLCPDVPSP
jgi:hypothetical protein